MEFIKLIEENIEKKQVKPNKNKIRSDAIVWLSPAARENLKNHLEFIKKSSHTK